MDAPPIQYPSTEDGGDVVCAVRRLLSACELG